MADHDRDRDNASGRLVSDAYAAQHPDTTTSEDVRPGDHASRVIVAATRLHDALWMTPDFLMTAPANVRAAYGQLQRVLGLDGVPRG